MTLSLRARLTAWYSILLVATLAAFSAAVLLTHRRLVMAQFDQGLEATASTAANVVREEVGELGDLGRAADEMNEVVRPADAAVVVLDATGAPVRSSHGFPALAVQTGGAPSTSTLQDRAGRTWRVRVLPGSARGFHYLIAVAAPLDEGVAEWRTLLRASLVGMPVAIVFAVAGGLWLGRHGLRPLARMAAEAQDITATTPERRLSVPTSGQELAQLAASFNHVLERLGSALSTQRQFMADASHELRTPISIMRTAADVTLSQPARDESEYREALAAVAQQSARLAALVDDMLVLARADAGGYPVRLAEVDVAEIVQGCVGDLRQRAVEERIDLQAVLQPAFVTADEALLRRLIGNLLVNALTYTPRGGAVRVEVAASDDGVDVRVADTGPGIAPQDRERIFERFVRLDPARAAGGAGLGLAIGRWIAELHGGSLRLESTGPDGSVFSATIPL